MSNGYDLDPTTASARAAQAEYIRLSEEAARLECAQLDLAYGDDHPRQSLDVFSAGVNAPVLIFFHGGYWRAGSKNARRFPAIPWHTRGVSWVCVNYRLTPEHTLCDAISDVRCATQWLFDNAAAVGLNGSKMHVTGNSAGGHLAAIAASAAADGIAFRSLCAISGLFDLSPLLAAKGNAWLNLDPKSAAELSPVNRLPPPDLPIAIGYGGAETKEFALQSEAYAKACRTQGNLVSLFQSPGLDHFDIIGEYGRPGSTLFRNLEALIDRNP